MEKFVKPYDKECMRMVMLKHEETFREQVYELHRLYQIQKMLMKNMGRGQNSNTQPRFDLEQLPAAKDQYYIHLEATTFNNDKNTSGGCLEIVDESEIELTLGPTRYNPRRKADTPLTSDSVPSFSSSSTGSSHVKRVNHNEILDAAYRWGTTHANMVPGGSSKTNPNLLSGRNKIMGSDHIQEQLRQDRLNQPAPWLYQVLSLNMTT